MVRISGRRLGWILGLPLTRTIELDRERILNVEVDGTAVRFEYREKTGDLEAVTLHCETPTFADRLSQLLPSERTADYRPKLTAEIDFNRRILAGHPNVPITVALVLMNFIAFIATIADGAEWLSSTGVTQIAWGSNFGPFTIDGDWWRLLTSTFIHFGVLHLVANMWFLAATGPLVERLFGSPAFLFLYGVCGVASSLASVSWHPTLNSAGASGPIFGLYGALLAALLRNDTSIPPTVIKPLRRSALLFTIYALTAGFLMAGVDNAAHVGGLVSGFTLGFVLARRLAIANTPATLA